MLTSMDWSCSSPATDTTLPSYSKEGPVLRHPAQGTLFICLRKIIQNSVKPTPGQGDNHAIIER